MRIITAVLLAASLGACALIPAPGEDLARQRQQAHDELDRWAAAVAADGAQEGISVIGSMTGQIGDWEPATGDNNKAALYAGLVDAVAQLPTDIPAAGEVRWDDNRTLQVALMTAAQALNEMRGDGSGCGGCTLTPLKVTGATLSSSDVSTSRGKATVPMWRFSVEGTEVMITRVAVAPAQTVTVSPPPWDPNDVRAGIAIDSAVGSASGLELTVAFSGAPNPASEKCGADYSAEAVESSLAVVVIVIEQRSPLPGACTAVGAVRTAMVKLAAPLGDRAVLEVMQGLPVPVTVR